jgi:putative sterol carrier protein
MTTDEEVPVMAEQPPVPDDVTPQQFFEQLLPMGFAAQAASGGNVPQGEFTMQYKVTGQGGGDWLVTIANGQMTARQGTGDAHITFTLSADDWRDAVLGRNGATLALILPQNRPGRPDNSGRAKQLRGTMALELARDAGEPFRESLTFNGAESPRTVMKMKMADYVAMQEGRLNGQEAFMTGKMRVEGDVAFLMQLAALTA